MLVRHMCSAEFLWAALRAGHFRHLVSRPSRTNENYLDEAVTFLDSTKWMYTNQAGKTNRKSCTTVGSKKGQSRYSRWGRTLLPMFEA